MLALYGKKIGMTQVFNEQGKLVPVTVILIEPSVVIGEKSESKFGYDSKLLGVFKNKIHRFTKSEIGRFAGDIAPRKKIYEVRGFEDVELGTELGVEVFETVNFVDVTGLSKGRGHQGVMRRHGASGGPAGHGSKFHRTIGSSGQATTPSRVRKGTKMSGRMGTAKITVQNLQVVKVVAEDGVLVVRGAIPGSVGSKVLVKEAIKKGI